MVQYPQLPPIPDGLPVSAELIEHLELLKHDDDFGTLDLYVGVAVIRIVEAVVGLERRLIAAEAKLAELGD